MRVAVNLRPEAAEAVGTFFLVLAGGGAILAGAPSLAVALAFGLAVAVLVYALGHVSGAHFNPAITVAFAATRHFPWRRVPGYLLAQGVGAVAAALVLRLVAGDVAAVATHARLAVLPAALVELLASFLLALVIIAVATDKRAAPGAAGLAIGLTVTVDALWAGPLTGASMNPARSLGPALASGSWGGLWLYLTAPVAGACLGMATYGWLRGGGKPEAPLGSLGEFDLAEAEP